MRRRRICRKQHSLRWQQWSPSLRTMKHLHLSRRQVPRYLPHNQQNPSVQTMGGEQLRSGNSEASLHERRRDRNRSNLTTTTKQTRASALQKPSISATMDRVLRKPPVPSALQKLLTHETTEQVIKYPPVLSASQKPCTRAITDQVLR